MNRVYATKLLTRQLRNRQPIVYTAVSPLFIPPKNGKIALQTPRTIRLSTFYYCQVVNGALLRLLNMYILVSYRVLVNYNIQLSNILYHWLLSMASFRFCETYLLHIKPFVVNKSAISPFWGGGSIFVGLWHDSPREISSRQKVPKSASSTGLFHEQQISRVSMHTDTLLFPHGTRIFFGFGDLRLID